MGAQNCSIAGATSVTANWFAGRPWRDNDKCYIPNRLNVCVIFRVT